jgi:hypothetical protein
MCVPRIASGGARGTSVKRAAVGEDMLVESCARRREIRDIKKLRTKKGRGSGWSCGNFQMRDGTEVVSA